MSTVENADVTKSWIDVHEEGAPAPITDHPDSKNPEAKQPPQPSGSGEPLSPLLVERHKEEDMSSVLSSPGAVHSDSSGESFEISDAFETNDAGNKH